VRTRTIIVALALLFGGGAEGRAWVISDKFSDVMTGSGGDLLVTRRVRSNVELGAEETMWDFFSKAAPSHPVLAVGFQKGTLVHRWEWDADLAYPKKDDLHAALRGVAPEGPKMSEAQFRSIVSRGLKTAPLISTGTCGAALTREKKGYSLKVGSFTKTFNWVHKDSAGAPYERGVDRCYEGKAGVVGVIVRMSGTPTAKSEKGEVIKYPGFTSESLVWTFEPPGS
jgi:hypothetical protein